MPLKSCRVSPRARACELLFRIARSSFSERSSDDQGAFDVGLAHSNGAIKRCPERVEIAPARGSAHGVAVAADEDAAPAPEAGHDPGTSASPPVSERHRESLRPAGAVGE